MTLQEFSALIKLPMSEEVEQLFGLMDTNDDGQVSFKEYVIGLATLSKNPALNDVVIRYAFQIFDIDGNGTVDASEFGIIMKSRFPGIDEGTISGMWKDIDKENKGSITYDQFSEYAKKHPQYIKVAEKLIQKKKAEGQIPPEQLQMVEDV